MNKVKILTVSDVHGYIDCIPKASLPLSDVDIVLLSGDLTHFGGRSQIEEVMNALREFNKNVYAITGNCDYPEVEDYLNEHGAGLNGKIINLMGVNIIGVSGSLVTPSNTPGEHPESFFEQVYASIEKDYPEDSPVILVTHQPPFNTLCDTVGGSLHTGCKATRDFINKHKPLACFCGHIHEASGIDQIGKTYIMNPGPFKDGGAILAEINLDERNADLSFIDLFN